MHLFCGFQPSSQVRTAGGVASGGSAWASPASCPPRYSATRAQQMMLWPWFPFHVMAGVRKQPTSVGPLLTQWFKQGGNSNSLERGEAPAREQTALLVLKANMMSRRERSCWVVPSHREARESAWLKALKVIRSRHFSDLLPYFSRVVCCFSHSVSCCSFQRVHIYNISQLK